MSKAWEEGQRDLAIAAEIDKFEKAAEQRLSEQDVSAALRAGGQGLLSARCRIQLARGLAVGLWRGRAHRSRRAAYSGGLLTKGK